MGLILDTSCLIDLERGAWRRGTRPPLKGLMVSAISMAELAVGVERASDTHRPLREAFVRFVSESAQILPFGLAEALRYAAVREDLSRRGESIGDHDLMIAATALANGHDIATMNIREFERVPGLTVVAWPP